MDPLPLNEALENGDLLTKLTSYGIKDVTALAEEYSKTRQSYDSSIRVPAGSATQEEWESYYKKIGRPESAEQYAIPEGAQGSQLQQTLESLRGIAHEKGLSSEAWGALADGAATASQTQQEAARSRLEEIKQGWDSQAKEQFGDRLEKLQAQGQRIVNQLCDGDTELKRILEDTGLSRHPGLMEAFAKVAAITTPESNPSGIEGDNLKQPIDQARDLANETKTLMHSDEYRQKNHPGHDLAMDKYYRNQKALQEMGFQGVTDPRLQLEYSDPRR